MTNDEIFKTNISDYDWREVVALTEDLPSMPNITWKAISLLENENVSGEKLNNILSKDTALVTRILRIANSAIFARPREISTINQASMLIGYKTLKGIIYAASVRKMYEDMSDVQEKVWEHSIATAIFATNIATFLKKSYLDEVFFFGLLHSLGQLALLNLETTRREYKKVLDIIRDKSYSYLEAEQEVFGFTHSLVGALLAKKWNFPIKTCQVILHYLDPCETSIEKDEISEKTALVRLSSLLAHKLNIGSPEGYEVSLKEIPLLSKGVGFNIDTYKKDLDNICKISKEQFEKEKENY
ncbi:MAG: HDOD domain-containing protein [Bdellovibrionota bacterium]|nr:HDOD domain-containing protein [Pseudomonadota bacterium]MDY6091129.1 HDOD domain-containing protein [Bdellovibrionota bacterium]